ncbi:MAG: glycosyltransferase [Actinomycetota bacterium]|nr:glycosyltransferase [Actinomycetota bacterium]
MSKKLISIVTPCYNEEGNVVELYERLKQVLASLTEYDYEHIFIDNASTDSTQSILRSLAASDHRVKVIFNMRNFGQTRSPYHAVLEARGDAVICMVSDLQDPPELISKFVEQWEAGFKVVVGQKTESAESRLFYLLRTAYYRLVRSLADVELIEHVTGFGLYDREVIERLRGLDDPYPYVRGLISEFGYPVARIPYRQLNRKSGVTKNNFYTLYDLAMLGFTSHSKVPLRLAAMLGFLTATLSLVAGLVYLVYKLLFWNQLAVGVAPLVIGLFFFSSVQLIFLGIVGEYVGAIYTQVLHRPLVVERERINFEPAE